MTDLLLVRHAVSRWNVAGRWQGQADPPLDPAGAMAALGAGSRVPRDLAGAVASDLRRATRTARLLAPRLELVVDPDLRERAAGPWEGLTHAEIDERWPGARDGGDHPPGWEIDAVVAERVRTALDRAAARHPPGARLLGVGHGGAIRAFERSLGADDGHPPHLHARWVRRDADGTWRIAGPRTPIGGSAGAVAAAS